MADEDRLAGFRDKTPAEIEAELREKLGDSEVLVDFMQMGRHMAAYAETPHGSLLINTFRGDLKAAVAKLLEQEDPGSPEFRKIFFEAKSRFLTLRLIDETVGMGINAEVLIIEADKVTP